MFSRLPRRPRSLLAALRAGLAPSPAEIDSLLSFGLSRRASFSNRLDLLHYLTRTPLSPEQLSHLTRISLLTTPSLAAQVLSLPTLPLTTAASLLEGTSFLSSLAPHSALRALSALRLLQGHLPTTRTLLDLASSFPDAAFEVFLSLLEDDPFPHDEPPYHGLYRLHLQHKADLALLLASPA